jgi:hypothetical protein
MNAESTRLEDARTHGTPWRRWGPYLSERQWGTVREDYSESSNAWNYFSHDQAGSLTNGEGNHGEDLKEYYYYLDFRYAMSSDQWNSTQLATK